MSKHSSYIPPLAGQRPPFWPALIATALGAGYVPVAPGTAGALVGVISWWILGMFLDSTLLFGTTLLLSIAFSFIGIITANKLKPYWGEDPSKVVIDETVGTWIVLLAAPQGHIWYALAAFALFRLFDIWKPLGIRQIENKLPGGIGVMVDDIVAGIYGLIILAIVRYLI